MTYAWNHDVLVVAASGNQNQSNFNNLVPARWAKVLTVGGTDRTDIRWWKRVWEFGEWAYYGANYGDPGLDLSAPADDIWSTAINVNDRTYHYGSDDGTSLAVPLVAGTVALMRKMDLGLTSGQLKTIINNAADKVGNYSYTINYPHCAQASPELGCGRLDAYEAVIDARDFR